MSTATTTGAGNGGAPDHGRPSGFSDDAHLNQVLASVLGRGSTSVPDPQYALAAQELLAAHRLRGLARVRRIAEPQPFKGSRKTGDGVDTALHGSSEASSEVSFGLDLDASFRRQQIGTGLVLDASRTARRALSAAGIGCVEFKGAALVRAGLYEDPGARPMDDADILVHPVDAHMAGEVLMAAGFAPWSPWKEKQTAWLDSFSLSAPNTPPAFPTAIDLHWRTAYGSLRFGESSEESLLWCGADLDRQLPTVEAHLLVVAEHLLKHARVKSHLLAYADLVRLAEAVEHWDRVIESARGRFFGPAVGVLLDVVRTDLGGAIPAAVIDGMTSRHGRVWRVRDHLRPVAMVRAGGSSVRVGRVAGLGWRRDLAPSISALAGDVFRMVFPSRNWLCARYGTGSWMGLWGRYCAACLQWAVRGGASPASPNQ